jgi:hypothetical protein
MEFPVPAFYTGILRPYACSRKDWMLHKPALSQSSPPRCATIVPHKPQERGREVEVNHKFRAWGTGDPHSLGLLLGSPKGLPTAGVIGCKESHQMCQRGPLRAVYGTSHIPRGWWFESTKRDLSSSMLVFEPGPQCTMQAKWRNN